MIITLRNNHLYVILEDKSDDEDNNEGIATPPEITHHYVRCGSKRLHNYIEIKPPCYRDMLKINQQLLRFIDEGLELCRKLSSKVSTISDMLETMRITASAFNVNVEISRFPLRI